jgi:preprotein translocase subunit SecD
MKGTLKFFLIFFITLFIIWVDLPEEIKDRYHLPKDIKIFSFKKEIKTSLGLDLKGGSHLVFDVSTNNIKKEDLEDAISSARDIIEKRVNFFGVSEPSVQTLKTGEKYRIVVDLPGIEDVSSAVKLIGQTAQLVFKEEKIIKDEKLATPTAVFVNTPLTGKDVKKASVVFSQQDGKPQVSLSFTPNGGKLFAEITKRNISKPLAIFIDNMLISAPIVQQEILDGNAVITGNFTVDQAKKLAIAINSGALPVTVNLIEQKNIGPTLGAFEVRKSVLAGIVGLFTVLLFMILYYGKLGLIASLALFIYGAISLAIFKIIPVVLTLPGVAGFILSIGMAVDSNILIFERMKEELRKGKSFEIAFNLGFGRAIDAIKDANVTTLTVAFILFNPLNWEFLPQFGMVRGFALTLAIGVATSLFTGVVITKRLIKFFYKI